MLHFDEISDYYPDKALFYLGYFQGNEEVMILEIDPKFTDSIIVSLDLFEGQPEENLNLRLRMVVEGETMDYLMETLRYTSDWETQNLEVGYSILGGSISGWHPVIYPLRKVFSWDGEVKSSYKWKTGVGNNYSTEEYSVSKGIRKMKALISLSYRDGDDDGRPNSFYGPDKNRYAVFIVKNGKGGPDGWWNYDDTSENIEFLAVKPVTECVFDVEEGDNIAISISDHAVERLEGGINFSINELTVTHFELWAIG